MEKKEQYIKSEYFEMVRVIPKEIETNKKTFRGAVIKQGLDQIAISQEDIPKLIIALDKLTNRHPY